MPTNSLSPGFIKFFYTGVTGDHVMTIPVLPVGVPTILEEPTFQTANGVNIVMDLFITHLVASIQPFQHTSVDYNRAEFWYQPTPDDDPLYMYTEEIGESGTNLSPAIPALQCTITFRTAAGGITKLVLLDISGAPNQVLTAPFSDPNISALALMLTAGGDAWAGRDGSYPVVPLKFITKTNDSLRKRYFNL